MAARHALFLCLRRSAPIIILHWLFFYGTTLSMIISRSTTCCKYMLAIVAMLFCVNVRADETMTRFPDWMNLAGQQSTDKKGINEPSMPIDPATGQPAAEQTRTKKFKPQLPDFKKMREKAVKIEMEKKSNDISSLEKSCSISIKNLEQLKSNKSELEKLLAVNPGPNERLQLLTGLKETEDKIKASEELLALIGGSVASGAPGQAIASLTPEQFDRALKLQKQLFANNRNDSVQSKVPGRPTPPKQLQAQASATAVAESDEEVEARAAKERHRPYRPGRIKSFYRESKEAQIKASEEAENE
ncbi:MAG TPA: hypothetical protein DCG57_05435 [Candidatus Riflebacteria bacterium]|nr:hypothetical protein [Candidatus Riflebacteria bacterium]